MRAFVDESFRPTRSGLGIYLFAVVVLAAVDEQPLRDRLRRWLPGRARRFHWHDDRDAVRERATRVLCAAPASSLVLLRRDVPQQLQERARQHALWNLVVELRDRDIHDVTLEARERRQDDHDKRNLAAIVKAGIAGSGFRYAFARPLDEPLLWLPDTLAGLAGSIQTTSPAPTPAWARDLYAEISPEQITLPPLPKKA